MIVDYAWLMLVFVDGCVFCRGEKVVSNGIRY